MKTFKNILIGLFSLILINLICLLMLSFNIQKSLVNGIVKEVIKNNYLVQDKNITNNEKINELLNSKETEELINKYLDQILSNVSDDKKLDENELKKDIIDYLRKNKKTISDISGKEISDVDIDKVEQELNNNSINKNITINSNKIPKESKQILKGYKSFISIKFQITLIVLIIIDLIIIGLLQWSLYKWIKTLSKCMITSGTLIIIMSLIVMGIVIVLSPLKSFNMNSLLLTGFVVLVLGIFILIIYDHFVDKEVIENEVS